MNELDELQRESRLKPKRIVPVRRQIVDPPKNPPSINAKTTYLNRRRAKTEEALKNLKDSLKADKSLKGSVWARDKVSRFKQEASNQVGPGRYTVDCQKKGVVHRSFSVGFASNTVRSFFDTIMYDTTNGRTLESRI